MLDLIDLMNEEFGFIFKDEILYYCNIPGDHSGEYAPVDSQQIEILKRNFERLSQL